MVSKTAVIRQTVLLSGAICVFPLILYPATLGFPLFSMHPLYAFAEWAFYFLIYLAILPSLPVRQKIVAGGITVLFRLTVGLVMGVLVSLMHGAPLAKAIAYCMWEYLPALGLHIIFAPFVLQPIFNRGWRRGVRFAIDSGRQTTEPRSNAGFSFSGLPPATSSTRLRSETGELSFEAATAWIGDYSGVRMSLVVDEDGLVVSHWSRQEYSQDAEFWAAVAVEMIRFHRHWPAADEPVDIRRLEVETASGKLALRRAGPFWLVTITEADAGELVSVRVTQAVEMIEKHYHDRYQTVRPAGLEVSHV
jgi:predicted regulator of Ras-like GTPase activity (Roadblock/LC7/MglB family)